MKKIYAYILLLAVFISSVIPVSADQVEQPQPRYVNFDYIRASITVDAQGTVSCTATAGLYSSLPIRIICNLQRYANNRWENIKIWETAGMGITGVVREFSVSSGYSYRLVVTGYAYDNNNNLMETASVIDYPG